MAFLLWLIATLLGHTWRVTVNDPFSRQPAKGCTPATVYSFWHGHLLTISFTFRNNGMSAVISGSKDGRIAAKIARLWKHEVIVGSSSRGGLDAMRQSVRRLTQNQCVGITPDGPRGPRHQVKSGVAQIAILAQAPVVILSMSANRYWQLRSWDGFIIPKPFAKVTVTVAEQLTPPSGKADRTLIETFRDQIEKEMRRVTPMA